jgi:PPOX class probable F420-dependent enzyme
MTGSRDEKSPIRTDAGRRTLAYHPAVSPPHPPVRALLSARVREFLQARRYAVLATINPDGSPHTAVIWYLVDDDGIVINSAVGRRWPSNLLRDPRASIAVEGGLDWVSLRGSVEPITDQAQAQADIAAMARKYDTPEDAERTIRNQFTRQERISFRLRPAAVHEEFGEG